MPKKKTIVPVRYQAHFMQVWADGDRIVHTSAGERRDVKLVWRCKLCGREIKPNTAGAQSHIAWHLRKADTQKGGA
jgi:hypothetical protein